MLRAPEDAEPSNSVLISDIEMGPDDCNAIYSSVLNVIDTAILGIWNDS